MTPQLPKPDARPAVRVTIVDLDMPISSLISVLLKLAIAAIPAALVLAVAGFAAFLILGAIADLVLR